MEKAEFVERPGCINCGESEHDVVAEGTYSDEPLRGFLDADPWGVNPLPFLEGRPWSLRRCKSCNQMYHGLILNLEWNARRFAEWMSTDAIAEFDSRSGKREADTQLRVGADRVAHALRIRKLVGDGTRPIRLLDFGCGWAEFVQQCKLMGFDAVGVDRSAPRAAAAVVKIHASLDDVSGDFDVVTLFETLEHLDDPADTVAQLHGRLRSGGLLILETPDCEGLTGISDHNEYRLAHPLEHINCFTNETLTSIAERRGFKRIAKPAVHVAADLKRVAKDIAKKGLGRLDSSTQLYFRKLG